MTGILGAVVIVAAILFIPLFFLIEHRLSRIQKNSDEQTKLLRNVAENLHYIAAGEKPQAPLPRIGKF
jgi:hypothetical protein